MICKRSSSSRTAEKKGEVKVGVKERVSFSSEEKSGLHLQAERV